MICKKILQTLLFVLFKIIFKNSFSHSNSVLKKKRIYENLISKLLQNALQIDKSFLFSQNSKTDFKTDFVFIWKLFQVASLSCKKKKGFHFKKRSTSKRKPLIKEKRNFPKWHLNLLYKNFGAWKCIQLVVKPVFPKTSIYKQNDFKMNFELYLREFQKLFWETTFFQKPIWSCKSTFTLFYKNNSLSIQKVLCKLFSKKALHSKRFPKKASLQNPMR